MTQQRFGEHSYANRFERVPNENVSQGVPTRHRTLIKNRFWNELNFVRFCPFKSHICYLCCRQGHKETRCRIKIGIQKNHTNYLKSMSVFRSLDEVNDVNRQKYLTV